jgi:hypothetical protein
MKVERIEVKRCFVVGEEAKVALKGMDAAAFQKGLAQIEQRVASMTEEQLNGMVHWAPRLAKYNELVWHFEECSIDDVGVWPAAGELPLDWCLGSVRETERSIRQGLSRIARCKGRALDNIPSIVRVLDIIRSSRYLAPIIVPGGTWRKYPCHQMKGDIDDGCMRAVAFAIKGYEKFNAYVGKSF